MRGLWNSASIALWGKKMEKLTLGLDRNTSFLANYPTASCGLPVYSEGVKRPKNLIQANEILRFAQDDELAQFKNRRAFSTLSQATGYRFLSAVFLAFIKEIQ
jgi:hypothetical protein